MLDKIEAYKERQAERAKEEIARQAARETWLKAAEWCETKTKRANAAGHAETNTDASAANFEQAHAYRQCVQYCRAQAAALEEKGDG